MIIHDLYDCTYIVYEMLLWFHRPTLHNLHQDSVELCEAITRASTLAESVSSKVRILDQAKVTGVLN